MAIVLVSGERLCKTTLFNLIQVRASESQKVAQSEFCGGKAFDGFSDHTHSERKLYKVVPPQF